MKIFNSTLLAAVLWLEIFCSCKKEESPNPEPVQPAVASYAGYYSCDGIVFQTDLLAGSVDTIYVTGSNCGVQFIDSGSIAGKELFGIRIDPLPYGWLPIISFSADPDVLQFETIGGYGFVDGYVIDTVTVSFAEGNKLTLNYSIDSWIINQYKIRMVAGFTGKKIE